VRAVRDIDEAEDWLDQWVAGVDARAARTAELARQVSALTAEASSEDGSITVTVGADGRLTGLEIEGDQELADDILAAMRLAQRHLSDQVAEKVAETVGADSETGRAVVDGFQTRFGRNENETQDDGGAGYE
jgi:DNA-binding protein YbaB